MSSSGSSGSQNSRRFRRSARPPRARAVRSSPAQCERTVTADVMMSSVRPRCRVMRRLGQQLQRPPSELFVRRDALADRVDLAVRAREEREDLVGLAQIARAQHDRVGRVRAVDQRFRPVRRRPKTLREFPRRTRRATALLSVVSRSSRRRRARTLSGIARRAEFRQHLPARAARRRRRTPSGPATPRPPRSLRARLSTAVEHRRALGADRQSRTRRSRRWRR